MCGICGFIGEGVLELRREKIAQMNTQLHHRGPDSGGLYVDDRVALGHRRLSILDLSSAGDQPMTISSGVTIVFNGEVYNFAALRRDLESIGRVFRGHSDTEVVLNVYDAWGLTGLKRLEGIFGLAIWDPRVGRLVLMRDRMGVKPLFYSRTGDGLSFGSEIKALLAAGDVKRSIDNQALSEYLWFGNSFEDRTMFASVRSLKAGHWLVLEGQNLRVEPWWRIEEWLESPWRGAYDEAVTQVRNAIDPAVARQIVADVPVGIFLSGGVDSSAIAATASRVSPGRLRSYAVGFDFDRGINELPKARRVAMQLGLDHHELHVRGSALEDVLQELVRAHDEPFADAANIPLFLLAKQLDHEVKVVLQGDGGDEMFAGYRRYSILRNAWAWAGWPSALVPVLRRLGRHGDRIARMAAAAGSRDPTQRMSLLLTVETLWNPPESLMQPDARQCLQHDADPFMAFENCARRFAAHEPVQKMLLTDICLQLPSQFLAKVDRSTMANGLEARVPLLDERVAELTVGMTSAFKVNRGGKKAVLRDAMRDRVPADILDGPKTGFGVPYEHWLRTSLKSFAADCILERSFLDRFGLDLGRVSRAFDDHVSARSDRGFMMWKLLQLALWSRQYG